MRKIYIALQSSQIFILLYCVRKLLPHLGRKWSYSFLHALSTGSRAWWFICISLPSFKISQKLWQLSIKRTEMRLKKTLFKRLNCAFKIHCLILWLSCNPLLTSHLHYSLVHPFLSPFNYRFVCFVFFHFMSISFLSHSVRKMSKKYFLGPSCPGSDTSFTPGHSRYINITVYNTHVCDIHYSCQFVYFLGSVQEFWSSFSRKITHL